MGPLRRQRSTRPSSTRPTSSSTSPARHSFGNPHSSQLTGASCFESRVVTTRVLGEAIARAERPPGVPRRQRHVLLRRPRRGRPSPRSPTSRGDAFLTRVAREWQAATAARVGGGCARLRAAHRAGAGPGLRHAQAAAAALPCGLGGRLGDGRQYFPLISLRDWVGAAVYLAESRDVSGAFNLCCPHTPTNARVHRGAGRRGCTGRRSSRRRRRVLRAAAGPMAPELLDSINARPAALERAGYDFEDEDVREVLAAALA